MRTRLIGLVLAISSMLVLVAPAAAQTATEDAYGGQAGAQQLGGGGDAAGVAVDSGSLPFTGAELTLIVVVALALIATGVVMRRLARSRAQTA